MGEPEEIYEGKLRKRYAVRLKVEESKARSPETAEKRFARVLAGVEKRAARFGWAVLSQGKGGAAADEKAPAAVSEASFTPRTPFRPPVLTDGLLAERFDDIYDRGAHLRVINDAVQTHALTAGGLRAHTLLYGEPGGCKSSLLERLKTVYDDDFERMVFLDATTMSKAGFERWILEHSEAGTLPEVVVLEEIEKVDNKDNLKCLGSVMASGYLMRTNANIGRRQTPAKFLVMATCNDEEALKGFMRGFIWDRFTNQEPCTLPTPEVMHKILLDKIAAIPGGNDEWAGHAMNLARAMGVRTPRKIIGFLAGRHRLEDGTYQRDKLDIARAGMCEKESLAGSR